MGRVNAQRWSSGKQSASHRASPKTGERRSLRKIAAELAAMGYLNERGAPYSAKSVRVMVAQ